MALCSAKCIIEYHNSFKKKQEKKATNLLKESLKTKSDYIKILQILVNRYVRLRDLGNSCISCNTILTEKTKYDAGHMYPTTYTFLRFHEDNINGQCVRCNRDLHGNTSEYRPKLEAKIGFDRLQWLHAHRHDKADFSIEWLKEQIIKYKQKLKDL
jgi:hypothetical protein